MSRRSAGDCRDHSGSGHHGTNRGVDLAADGAVFDGRGAHVLIPPSAGLDLGAGDFTLAVEISIPRRFSTTSRGDIVSRYDPATRTGFQLSLLNNAGVTAAQARSRGGRDRETRFVIDAHVHVLAKASREFPREVSDTMPADREESAEKLLGLIETPSLARRARDGDGRRPLHVATDFPWIQADPGYGTLTPGDRRAAAGSGRGGPRADHGRNRAAHGLARIGERRHPALR